MSAKNSPYLLRETYCSAHACMFQERAVHPRVQLTLEERLRQRLSEKRRSGRARVLKARELANATPQERARHYWGVMREAVLTMHQFTVY